MAERVVGYRFRHATWRGRVGIIQDPRPVEPYFCGRCAATNPRIAVHKFKTHHIVIDSEGYCIVSKTVKRRLNEAGAIGPQGFTFVNTVRNPPPQGMTTRGFTIDNNLVEPGISGAVLLEGVTSHG